MARKAASKVQSGAGLADDLAGPGRLRPKTFTGPFVYALSFAQFLLPLAVLELYLSARGRGMALAVTLGLLTLATGAGIFGAAMRLWLPRLS